MLLCFDRGKPQYFVKPKLEKNFSRSFIKIDNKDLFTISFFRLSLKSTTFI